MIYSSDIRREARELLGGSILKKDWLYPMIVGFIVSMLEGAFAFTGVATLLVHGILATAVASYFSSIARAQSSSENLGVAVDGGMRDFGGNIVLGVLVSIFTFLWTLLLVVPGVVKACSYSMAYFIKNDHPEYSATEALDESKRMMQGHKWEYFVLQCSFIGWYFVGALCALIGVFWVNAYVNMANAVFYEKIKDR